MQNHVDHLPRYLLLQARHGEREGEREREEERERVRERRCCDTFC
jgi:hypothetical protein